MTPTGQLEQPELIRPNTSRQRPVAVCHVLHRQNELVGLGHGQGAKYETVNPRLYPSRREVLEETKVMEDEVKATGQVMGCGLLVR